MLCEPCAQILNFSQVEAILTWSVFLY